MMSGEATPYGTEAEPLPGATYLGCWTDSRDHMYPVRVSGVRVAAPALHLPLWPFQ